MSEGGGGYEPSAPPTFPKDFKYKPQAIDKLTDSPLIKRPKDQIENTFLKNKPVVLLIQHRTRKKRCPNLK